MRGKQCCLVCPSSTSSASFATTRQPRHSSRIQRGPRRCLAYGLRRWQGIQPERTSRMKTISPSGGLPELTRYTKYYEQYGLLRAYANRARLRALIFAVLALAALGFSAYVSWRPPNRLPGYTAGNVC